MTTIEEFCEWVFQKDMLAILLFFLVVTVAIFASIFILVTVFQHILTDLDKSDFRGAYRIKKDELEQIQSILAFGNTNELYNRLTVYKNIDQERLLQKYPVLGNFFIQELSKLLTVEQGNSACQAYPDNFFNNDTYVLKSGLPVNGIKPTGDINEAVLSTNSYNLVVKLLTANLRSDIYLYRIIQHYLKACVLQKSVDLHRCDIYLQSLPGFRVGKDTFGDRNKHFVSFLHSTAGYEFYKILKPVKQKTLKNKAGQESEQLDDVQTTTIEIPNEK